MAKKGAGGGKGEEDSNLCLVELQWMEEGTVGFLFYAGNKVDPRILIKSISFAL